MAGSHALLTGLQSQQAGAHAGQPGGLGAAMPAQERTDLLNFAHKHKPKDFLDSCSVAPDQVNAHDIMRVRVSLVWGPFWPPVPRPRLRPPPGGGGSGSHCRVEFGLSRT